MSYNNILIVVLMCFMNMTSDMQSKSTINFSEYTFNTITGEQTSITLEDDKIYILDFWYLECAPCIKDHQVIAKYSDYAKKQNIEIIGISIDRSKSKWAAYLETHDYNWTNYNQFGTDKSLYNDLEIQFFPTYLVVNSKGDLLHKANRFKSALDFIEASNIKNE